MDFLVEICRVKWFVDPSSETTKKYDDTVVFHQLDVYKKFMEIPEILKIQWDLAPVF